MRRLVHRVLLFVAFIALAFGAVSSPVEAQEQTVGLFLNEAGSFDGYTLFAPNSYETTYLIDNEGRLVHSWDSDYLPGLSAYLLEDGSLLRAAQIESSGVAGGGGRVERLAWDGTLEWEFEYANDEHKSHHDIELLPNGNVLMIARERKTSDEAIAAGRDPAILEQDKLLPLHIIEVEPTGASGGNIVWEWHVWDHLVQDYDATKANYGVVADHPELTDINFTPTRRADWHHANSIDYNPDFDQIVVSLRHLSEIWVIDHSTTTAEAAGHSGGNSGKGGDLLYRWGNPEAYRAGDVADQKMFFQHDAQWIEPGLPGEGNILVFNNGPRPDGEYSSVEEIVPPVDGSGNYSLTPGQAYGPVEPTWTYMAPNPTDFFSRFISGAQRLPNGNTLIAAGPQGTFFDVTPEGTTVWKYVNPVTNEGPLTQGDPIRANANHVFRAHRYAPDFPGLQGRDLTPGLTIEIVDTDGDGLSDQAEETIGTDPLLADTDGDGCSDGAELGDDERRGGLRDPLNPWDFYDTNGDGTVDVPNDLLPVISMYLLSEGDEGYDARFDRGPLVGLYIWNRAGPDGTIDVPNDLLPAISQYLHTCQ